VSHAGTPRTEGSLDGSGEQEIIFDKQQFTRWAHDAAVFLCVLERSARDGPHGATRRAHQYARGLPGFSCE